MYDIDPANLDRCRDQFRLSELETENTSLRGRLAKITELARNAELGFDEIVSQIRQLTESKL